MNDFARLNLIGQSVAFVQCLRLIEKIAGCDATVLIQGETGTGKELAARAIHYLGARHDNPFVPLNCGAIPDSLIESELFGHEKGAFTNATHAKPGVIAQAADNGTLFLDEIDMLSLKGQVAILRFLQDLRYRPLGHHRELSANVRIIAASNRVLADLVRAGEFRADLLYRLNILYLPLPPLRDREGDAKLLAQYFVTAFAAKYRTPPKHLHEQTARWIQTYDWPGNIRELENVVHREFLMSDGAEIHYTGEKPGRQPAASAEDGGDFRSAKARAIAAFERAYLARVISQAHGNISYAARIARKERRAFAKLLKKHGMDRTAFSA
jgi:DNA-binding NtrC family response regulator